MQVQDIHHVRNGGLESFTQVLFSDRPSYKSLMAIAFGEDPNYRIAVINLNDLPMKLDPDSWRSRIHSAIAEWNDSWDVAIAEYTVKFPFVPKEISEKPETEIEYQRKSIISFVNSIADSTQYTEEVRLQLLRGALLTQLKINPDNIISDEERIRKEEEANNYDDDITWEDDD